MTSFKEEVVGMETEVANAGYSMRDLWYHAQVSEQSWGQWKRGNASPSYNTVSRIQGTLNKMIAGKIETPNFVEKR
jgi:predicted transcriptional regulator